MKKKKKEREREKAWKPNVYLTGSPKREAQKNQRSRDNIRINTEEISQYQKKAQYEI